MALKCEWCKEEEAKRVIRLDKSAGMCQMAYCVCQACYDFISDKGLDNPNLSFSDRW